MPSAASAVPQPKASHLSDAPCFVPGKWEEVAIKSGNPPEPRIAHAQAVVGSKIYCFGGRASVTIEEAPMGDLHVFDAEEGGWSEVPTTGTPPSPRRCAAMGLTASRARN